MTSLSNEVNYLIKVYFMLDPQEKQLLRYSEMIQLQPFPSGVCTRMNDFYNFNWSGPVKKITLSYILFGSVREPFIYVLAEFVR